MSFSFQPPENLKIQQAPKSRQFKGQAWAIQAFWKMSIFYFEIKLTFLEMQNVTVVKRHSPPTMTVSSTFLRVHNVKSKSNTSVKRSVLSVSGAMKRLAFFQDSKNKISNQEKQAETHYRNSIYNGHQLHRFHHRQYFNFVRQRKSPGRPPRSAESFAPRKAGLMENSLLNFSLS